MGGGEFRDLEVSTPAERLAARHERIGLDIRWRDGQTRLVLMGEDPVWSEERPLDGRDKGSVVDILEIWTFRYGKPAAVCTNPTTQLVPTNLRISQPFSIKIFLC